MSHDPICAIPPEICVICGFLRSTSPGLRGATLTFPCRGLNFTLTTTIGDIDLFGEIPGGGGFGALRLHVIDLVIFSRTCRCLDLPWLIRTKRAAGRPKDIEVLAELESSSKNKWAETARKNGAGPTTGAHLALRAVHPTLSHRSMSGSVEL
ncbi:MAG: hypothetical protein HYX75_18845 [Acidobacteria bacterium]|nr:hypothetical protein [Acidobacteriota bacterium]